MEKSVGQLNLLNLKVISRVEQSKVIGGMLPGRVRTNNPMKPFLS